MKKLRKFWAARPSLRFAMLTILACLTIGCLMFDGITVKASLLLPVAVMFLALVTLRRYDPIAWEAFTSQASMPCVYVVMRA